MFGSGETGCAVRARLKCADCGCYPGRDTEERGKWVFPQARFMCVEDGCSPDEGI